LLVAVLSVEYPLRKCGTVAQTLGHNPLLAGLTGIVASVLAGLVMLWLVIRQLWTNRQFNRTWQAAARGDTLLAPLAEEQPQALADEPQLPITIQLLPRWGPVIVHIFLAGVGFEAGVVLLQLPDGTPLRTALLVPFPSVIFITALFGWLIVLEARQRIEVTDEQLTISGSGKPHSIRWTDAQVFAIAHYGNKAGAGPVFYTLGSVSDRVGWVRVCERAPILTIRAETLTNPTTPVAEYERQMEIMLTIVAAKTGLPLHDFR
jgi:hypothetical protein